MNVVRAIRAYAFRTAARNAARAGDLPTAVVAYSKLMARGVATSRDMVQLAHSLKEVGDTAAASDAYRAAAATFPHDIDAQLQLGLFLVRVRQDSAAKNAVARTLAMDPENVFARTTLAEMGVGEDTIDEEMLAGIMAGHDAPRTRIGAVTRIVLGWHLGQARRHARAQRWEAAGRQYRRMLSFDPYDPRILVQLGHVLRKQGDAAQAIVVYRTALISLPRNPDTYVHLGHAFKTLGRHSAALQAYLTALRLQPGSPPAIAELRALGWSESDMTAASRHSSGFEGGDQGSLPPPLPRLKMPDGLTRRQRSIWKLLAHAENGN